MTTRPAGAVFGLSDPQWGVASSVPNSNPADDRNVHFTDEQPDDVPPGTDVAWVNTELHSIASVIEELQSRLKEANTRLASVEKVETTEFEIGQLFVEAQRFSEASLADLELKIHEVLDAAQSKAVQILTEATEEAQQIRREAQNAAFASTRTVQELQSAISGFTTVNAELLKELGTLNNMLAPGANQERVESAPIPATELPPTERD